MLAGCASYSAFKAPRHDARAAPVNSVSALDAAFEPPRAGSERTLLTEDAIARLVSADPLEVNLPPQPLPQFVNTVFGDLLAIPFVMEAGVADRTEQISVRSGAGQTRRDFLRQVETALRSYGVQLYVDGGAVHVVARNGSTEPIPLRLTGRPPSAAAGPADPVTRVFQARSIEAGPLAALVGAVLPGTRRTALSTDEAANSVTATGAPRDVAAVARVLEQLDQPRFSGVGVFRIEPVYWSAESLARSLEDTLQGEGFTVGSNAPAAPRSVLVAPFANSNQILVFAKDAAVLDRARSWAAKLDQPASLGGASATFVYVVRNTDAASLATLVTASSPDPARASALPPGAPGAPPAAVTAFNTAGVPSVADPATSANGAFQSGRIVVDTTGNRILFTGRAEEFAELRGLLATLDIPTREVLIEVTIAEVTLTDETRAGLEWFFNNSMSGGRSLSGGTQGGLGLGSDGLALKFIGTDLRAAFNAFASNNKVNILSRPRLVARSGSQARIQVGTDVPIITSQANSSTQTGGNTDILQTIQYRQTGVILTIRPLIYGDDRVDVEITQEVSSQQPNSNSAIGSPLILNRNITTQLSLAEGATAVLGGLIDDSYTKGNRGIPLLKDVPLLGSAFRTDTLSSGKTELVMLVTPHILGDPGDMGRWAERYGGEMDAAFRLGHGWSYTLTPYKLRGVGIDLSKRPSDPR